MKNNFKVTFGKITATIDATGSMSITDKESGSIVLTDFLTMEVIMSALGKYGQECGV